MKRHVLGSKGLTVALMAQLELSRNMSTSSTCLPPNFSSIHAKHHAALCTNSDTDGAAGAESQQVP